MAWPCPTCAQGVDTEYCPRCGERRILPRELTLRGLGRQFLKSTSSIDGRLFRTLRALLARPGALTVAWVDGPRKPYVGPIQLFLLANVAFVAAQSLTGSNVFSSTPDARRPAAALDSISQRRVTSSRLPSITAVPSTMSIVCGFRNRHSTTLPVISTVLEGSKLPVTE